MKKQLCAFIFLLSASSFVFGYSGNRGNYFDKINGGNTCAPRNRNIQRKKIRNQEQTKNQEQIFGKSSKDRLAKKLAMKPGI